MSTDRTALIRKAAQLPKGSRERRQILAGLAKTALATGSGNTMAGVVEDWLSNLPLDETSFFDWVDSNTLRMLIAEPVYGGGSMYGKITLDLKNNILEITDTDYRTTWKQFRFPNFWTVPSQKWVQMVNACRDAMLAAHEDDSTISGYRPS